MSDSSIQIASDDPLILTSWFLLKAKDAQTPGFTHLFLMSTEGWDAGIPSLPSLSASQP